MISAHKANNLIKNREKYLYKEQLKELNAKIKDLALEGKQCLSFHFPLEDKVIAKLEKKGYKVEKINYTYFNIYW